MAKSKAKKPDLKKPDLKETDAGPDIAPHGREKMMEAHKDRRQKQPAAAPLETDAESGGASAVAGLPEGEAPRDPAKPYLEGEPEPQQSQDVAADEAQSGAWIKWAIGILVVLAVLYAALQV